MKLHYLLLPAALLFAACGNEELEGVQPNLPITGPSTLLATATPIFPEADSSVQLSANGAEGVMQLLKSIDPKKALNLNEQDITDAEYKEIKIYVTKNLKAENDYQTYKNIYNWLIKNIKYPWGMFLTSDHTTSLSINAVYAKAMLTCLRRCAIRRASLAHVLMATWFPWAHTLGTMFTWMVIGM